jgi:SEC-C motif-containing protein
MRSRYAANVMGNAAYLLTTWHPATRPPSLELNRAREWLLLRIVAASADGDRGIVEFVARSRLGGHIEIMHEVSRFVREGGRWLYVDGDLKEQ